jgi:predicted AlkP superfamily phosphohydrolase/phosphomutase
VSESGSGDGAASSASPGEHGSAASSSDLRHAGARRKVLALAIDGGSPELLRRWAAEGVLPNLARLIGAGAHGVSRGLEHFFVGSTWPTLYTGTSPAEHGHHSLIQLRRGSYEYFDMADGDLVKRAPFWEHLSRAGRRVAILDVPLAKLSPDLNGIQTVEWGSHDAVYGFHGSTHELEREIEARFGTHPLGPTCDGVRRSAEDYDEFLRRLVAGVERKTQLTLALLQKESWDFCIQVFTESHCAGHQCWHLHDAAHPAHDAAIRSAIGDPLERVYRAIDHGIGEIATAAGDDLTLVVFSAHGMSYWYGAQLLLRDVLIRLAVTAPLPAQAAHTAQAPRHRAAPSPLATMLEVLLDVAGWGWRHLPASARERLKPLRRRFTAPSAAPTLPTLGVDAARSLCFPVYNGLVEGGIRLNLAGREPSGRLQPGAEADAFCAELRRELLAITDERTGHRLVRDVVRTADVVEGEQVLSARLQRSEELSGEIEQQMKGAEALLAKLTRIATAGRQVEPAVPTAPDPKAVAAAAQAFTERARARLNGLAA